MDLTVRLWDVAARQELERIEDQEFFAMKLLFSRDGSVLAGYWAGDVPDEPGWVSEVVIWEAPRDEASAH
jgi:hypothetical protein